MIRGVDPEGTGMGGRCFEILGRVPKAELRGCSDTFTAAGMSTGEMAAFERTERPWHADRRPRSGCWRRRTTAPVWPGSSTRPGTLRRQPFAAARLDTLARLSAALLADPVLRQDPASVSVAYWLRRAQLARLAEEYAARAASAEPDVAAGPGGPGAAPRAGQRGHVVHLLLGAGLSLRQRQRRPAVAGAGHHRRGPAAA